MRKRISLLVVIATAVISALLTGLIFDSQYAPAIADLNGDGLTDIVTIDGEGNLIVINGLNGGVIWTRPLSHKQTANPIVGDFDGDGRMDVAAIDTTGVLHVGYSRLQKTEEFYSHLQQPEWVNLNIEMASLAPLSCFDFDADGAQEILIGTEHGLVLIYDGVERRVKANVDVNLSLNKLKNSFNVNHPIRYPASMADLNGDRNADMVVTTQQGDIVCLDLAGQKIEGKIKTRELWWR